MTFRVERCSCCHEDWFHRDWCPVNVFKSARIEKPTYFQRKVTQLSDAFKQGFMDGLRDGWLYTKPIKPITATQYSFPGVVYDTESGEYTRKE